MGGVTVASIIVLIFLPLGVIGKAVGVGQPVTEAVLRPTRLPIRGQISRPVVYQYMQFVLQVPRTVNPHLRTKQYPPLTIHGLWPSNFSKPSVEYCNWPKMPWKKLSRRLGGILQTTLLQSWPNVETPADPFKFWTHEYDRHGSCAVHSKLIKFKNPAAYFGAADKLYDRKRVQDFYDLYTGILNPTLGQVHTATYFSEIQQANGGHFPGLRCNQTNNYLLQEVVICYDASATNVRDCPFRVVNCAKFITFPI